MKTWLRGKSRLILATVIVSILGALAWLYMRPDPPAPEPKAEVITRSTDTPDETKPEEGYQWRGGPQDPKYITLPTIQAEGFVQNVGVDQHKEMAVPNNINFAGWFVDSVRPGEKGLSIIDGHLNGHRADGIFANLETLETGAKFTVEFGDGSRRTFVVKRVQAVDLDKAADVLFSQDPDIKNQLNLITCGGTFDREARLYDKRVIVISELEENG